MGRKKRSATAADGGVKLDDRVHPCCHDSSAKLEGLRTLNSLLIKETKECRDEIANLKSEMAGVADNYEILAALESSVSAIVLSGSLKSLAGDLAAKGVAETTAIERVQQLEVELNNYIQLDRASKASMLALIEEKSSMELRLHSSEREKKEMESNWKMLSTEVNELRSKLKEFAEEKIELQEEMAKKVEEVRAMENKVTFLELTVSNLEQCCEMKDNRSSQLESHKKQALSELHDERDKMSNLHAQLEELTKGREAMEAYAGKLKFINESLTLENKEKTMQYNLLMEAKNSIEENLRCAKTKLEHQQRKVIAGKKSLQTTISMLNNATRTPLVHVPRGMDDDLEMDVEMQQMVAHLVEIKTELENKKLNVEELSKELESLKYALAEVKKNTKGFSSWIYLIATTCFASLLFAYGSKAIF